MKSGADQEWCHCVKAIRLRFRFLRGMVGLQVTTRPDINDQQQLRSRESSICDQSVTLELVVPWSLQTTALLPSSWEDDRIVSPFGVLSLAVTHQSMLRLFKFNRTSSSCCGLTRQTVY
jgi:hypothetical protein